MENFKIKSIEEFDLDFVAEYNKPSDDVPAAETEIIPDINTPAAEPQTTGDATVMLFDNVQPAVIVNTPDTPVNTPAQQQNPEQPQTDAPVAPVPPQPVKKTEEKKKTENKKKPEKVKQSGLAIAGKIIATIMLVITVITFVSGCFVSVFLDNDNLDIGIGINTVTADTSIKIIEDNQIKDVTIFSKGDLVISKKVDPLEYFEIYNESQNVENSKLIYLTYSTIPESEDTYSDIYLLKNVISTSESSAVFTATNLTAGNNTVVEISSDDKNYHGIVTSIYIPMLGGILHFAIDNAILVCILFILVAALWCLVLVLIDNRKNKAKKKEKAKK